MRTMKIVIGVDGGSTKTAVRIADLQGATLATATNRRGGTNLHAVRGRSVVVDALDRAIRSAIRRIPSGRRWHTRPEDCEVVAACVGTAGLDQPGDAERHRRAFGRCRLFAGCSLDVVSDVAIIADCGSAPVRVCLIAGTGSNCYAAQFDSDSRPIAEIFVGGLDLTIADDGSAAWAAHQAFREAVYAVTARDRPTRLGTALCRRFRIDPDDPRDWRRLKGIRERLPKRRLAALSEKILLPLAENGDAVAIEIFRESGSRLARMASGALKRLPPSARAQSREALLVGGMWGNRFVLETFTECLQRNGDGDLTIVRVGDPTEGAVKIALRRARRALRPA